ncbi:MAG: hypothetical protein P1T08_12295 [Acidimicrobiia bacterium]|nr:hypothetical protein [Acidimicrobiia bacterium]
MKRIAMIALVLMMLLAATPAMAAKGGKPLGNPDRFEVELSGVLNTTCATEGTIPMTGTVPGTLSAGLSPEVVVGVNLAVPWERDYDAGWGASAAAFSGCHGIGPYVPDGSFGGTLILEVDGDGEVTLVNLLFDYYWQFGVNPKNGRPVQEVLEMFSLKSYGTGTFSVTLFTKEGKEIVNDWIPVGSSEGTLTATITPAG